MKKSIFAFAVLSAFILSACDFNKTNQPEEKPAKDTTAAEVIPESFPRKHLIEEFTGQDCGYCPYGMDCIHEFIENDTNWIVVLHHYGYTADNFSVRGSDQITSRLRVDGAPSMTIDRAKTKTEDGTAVVFHPGYLPSTDKTQFESTTFASVRINNEYDQGSNVLTVNVSGALCNDEHPNLKLTVLIKESGMIDYQSDYYNTFEGWKSFCHTNAVRAYLTAALGDTISVDTTRHYNAEFALKMNAKWVPENCMVVAFLSEDFQPVVQAAQCPVVAGTQGGAEITHGGVEANPVSESYPEPDATSGPSDFSDNRQETMDIVQVSYQAYPSYGFNYWTIMGYSTTNTVNVYGNDCNPFAYMYVFTALDETTIPVGTYPFTTTLEPGTAYAGYRDDAHFEVGGSRFYFTHAGYLAQGYLVPVTQWLIAEGTLTVTATGWSVNGTARNGAPINLVGTQPLRKTQANMPIRYQIERKEHLFQ